MILTIAMVVYNEEKRLPLIRGNLQVFKNFPSQIRTILIDNGSTDQTVAQISALQSDFDFHFIRRTQNNMGGARADAVLAAATPWLAFLDADCTVDKNWVIHALVNTTALPETVAAFGGPWVPAGRNQELYSQLFNTFYGNFNMPQIMVDGETRLVRHIPTASVVYRRQELVEAGNFDSEQARVGEDLDMSYRLLSRKRELLMVPELRFSHYLPESLGSWVRKIFTYGNARIRAAILHGDLMALNYLLPIVFFLFVVANIVFLPAWKGIPFAAYLLTALTISLYTSRSFKGLRVLSYMLGTHFAYSTGMVWGAMSLTCEKILKRKPLAPRHYTPESLEEI